MERWELLGGGVNETHRTGIIRQIVWGPSDDDDDDDDDDVDDDDGYDDNYISAI